MRTLRYNVWFWLAVIWLTLPVLLALWWLVMYSPPLFDGMDWKQEFQLWVYEDLWHGVWFWWYCLAASLVSAGYLYWRYRKSTRPARLDRSWHYSSEPQSLNIELKLVSKKLLALLLAASGVALLGSTVMVYLSLVSNDKRVGNFYGSSTVFYVSDTAHAPTALSNLIGIAQPSTDERCKLKGTADVDSCIQQGSLPDSGWDARTGSLEGAKIALKRSSAAGQGGVQLDERTVTYLNASRNQQAGWSGILDGSNISIPMGGVAEWSGSGNPTECLFQGQYAIDRAFAGGKLNSMSNYLAEQFPWLTYDMNDVWGYCTAQGEPIVIIPVTTPTPWVHETVSTAAGIIKVQGDNGHTKLSYEPDVTPGEFPGPVYPSTLTASQRDANQWAAGRGIRNNNSFGFEPTDSEAQAGNISEYLLRDTASGRLVYVTPLRLRGGTDVFTAYAISYADEVHAGSLNQLSIYVLDENDKRKFNIDNLDAKAKDYIITHIGSFVPGGGRLVEFTPVDGDIWRAFAELNGRVIYALDISASNSLAPKLIKLDDGQEAITPTTGGGTNPAISSTPEAISCGADPGSMSDAQLATCLQQFSNELVARSGGN